MHPAFSILFFTTLAGAAQGLLVVLAIAVLGGVEMSAGFVSASILFAEVLLIAGLAASFMHLGRKMRAWRAVLMWRTSWMSREVIVLPAFIGLVALWWLSFHLPVGSSATRLLPLLVVIGALALWYCTAMIYACLRFIEEWAHPLTIVNFTLIGLSSGLVLAGALGAITGEAALVAAAGPCALAVTLIAWLTRWLALRRNATLRHKSTLQSATGIKSSKLVQKSMGMSAGSFNTREFFHHASAAVIANVRLGSQLGAFVLPVLLMIGALASHAAWPWVVAILVQAPGVLADRWFFFAQAKHPQNLYYQAVN
jgi:sulfite dehydrogenase (quinone) subunit SoeC